jgi:hypothetical protein
MNPRHLVLIAPSHLVDQVIAEWQRILPEEGVIYHTIVVTAIWKGDTLAAFHADDPQYIEGLVKVIHREIADGVPLLMTCF